MKAFFTDPVVCPKDRDMNKEWFIYFRWTDHLSGKRFSFKKRADLNSIKHSKDRLRAANKLAEIYRKRLEDGWNPLTEDTEKEQERKTLIEFLNEVLSTKATVLKKKSYHKYDKVLNLLIEWMGKNNYKHLYPQNFTKAMALGYLDFLLSEKKYSGKSHNTQLGIIKSLFNALLTREIISKNPFIGIHELPEDHGKNFPFTDQEKELLKSYMQDKCPHFFAACCFTYFCFIRRSELIEIRIQDIDLLNMTIRIHSEGAKNRSQQSVTIPKAMEQVLRFMNLEKYPANYYVFGRNFKVNEHKTQKPDYLSCKFRRVVEEVNKLDNPVKIDESKGFYAWKHTGVCALYNATKDPYLVMQQCRHSDVKITMIYLRSLGLTVSERIREANYSF